MVSTQLTIICGPTAVGKTALGIELCRRFNGEIVSADSQQVYRGIDIGTAKDDLIGSDIPCHLVDVVDPDEVFDVSKFKEMADAAIADIVDRGKKPFIVGGTGLYIKALVKGLCDAPGRDEAIRAELMELREKEGQEALYKVLEAEDPIMAERLHPNDATRIIRAIEVKRSTGKSLAEIQLSSSKGADSTVIARSGDDEAIPCNYLPLKLALNIDRTELYDRINARIDRMIERGLVAEVEGLVSKYGPGIQSLKAVGYKEIVSYLKGEILLEEAIELTKRNTRRFAKRQLTWFRADSDIRWYHPSQISEIVGAVEAFEQ